MRHNRLSMKHFSYPMANKVSNNTKLEFICMIPSKIECRKYTSCQFEIMIKIQPADESMTRSLHKEYEFILIIRTVKEKLHSNIKYHTVCNKKCTGINYSEIGTLNTIIKLMTIQLTDSLYMVFLS